MTAGSSKPFIFYLPADQKTSLQVISAITGYSMAEVIRQVLSSTTNIAQLNQIFPECSGKSWGKLQ
jgi:hypothetical protein